MTRHRSIICAVLLSSLLAQRSAHAAPPAPQPGDNLDIYVFTFGPGDDPWEKWGHNAIRIVDPSRKPPRDDLAYNWGEFPNFNAAFYWEFIQGRLRYSLGSHPTFLTVQYYVIGQSRPRLIYMQKLNLTAKQKWHLRNKLKNEDTDANRFYLYNYYSINCSTKVRDAVDEATGGALARLTANKLTDTTYRFHTDRLDCEDLWLYVALQGVLGHPVDRRLTQWEEMFVPLKLHDRLNEATVEIDGKKEPLVAPLSASDIAMFSQIEINGVPQPPLLPEADLQTGQLLKSGRPPDLERPPVMAPWLLGAGVALGAVFALLGHFARRHWTARWGFVLLTTPWLLMMTLGGALIWWGWLATNHDVARYNENAMHVSVLALPLLVMLPCVAFGVKRGAKWTRWLAVGMGAISALGFAIKVLPWFYQVNLPIIALCLPVNLALAYAAWAMTRKPQKTGTVMAPARKDR